MVFFFTSFFFFFLMTSIILCWKRSVSNGVVEHKVTSFRELVKQYWPDLDLQAAALDPSLWPSSPQPPWPRLSRCPWPLLPAKPFNQSPPSGCAAGARTPRMQCSGFISGRGMGCFQGVCA